MKSEFRVTFKPDLERIIWDNIDAARLLEFLLEGMGMYVFNSLRYEDFHKNGR